MTNIASTEARHEEQRVVASDLFARILVPIDFSSGSRRALQLALELRRRFRGTVMLINVAGPSDGDDFLGGIGAHYSSRDIVDAAEQQLHQYVANVAPDEEPVLACRVALEGSVSGAVKEAVDKYKVSLVLLPKTTRKRRPVFRTKSERIASGLCCAVMFVGCEDDPDVARD